MPLVAPRCGAELAPPSAACAGSALCATSCAASATARAVCAPPALVLVFDGAPDAALRPRVGALQQHLPAVIAAEAHLERLLVANEAMQLVGFGAGETDVVCVVDAVAATSGAGREAERSLDAAHAVLTEAGR